MSSSISSFNKHACAFCAGAAAVFLIIAGASEWLVRAKVIPEDSLYKHVALVHNTTSPFAAFGDSHVARNFHAAAPVVNLAYPSENIEKMHWKATHYLDRIENPETILIQADPHLFAPYRTGAGLGDYERIFAGDKPPISMALSERYRPQLIALWRSFIENGGTMKSDVEMTAQGTLLSPGDLSKWSSSQVSKFVADRVQLHRPADGFQASITARHYREMIMAFVARGAEVCLVAFPTSPVYRARIEGLAQDDQKQFWMAITFFQELADTPEVKFIDDSARFSDVSFFRDPDHLNKKGARHYGPTLQESCFGEIEINTPTPRIAAVK